MVPERGERSLFPLPRPVAPERIVGAGHRGQQRLEKDIRRAELVNDAIDSLNWLHGCRAAGGVPLAGAASQRKHEGVWARLDLLAARVEPAEERPPFRKQLCGVCSMATPLTTRRGWR